MRRIGAVLLLLMLAACGGTPPELVSLAPLGVGAPQGIDLPTDARDVSGELRAHRLDFIARYYRDPASRWPALSPAEAAALTAQGYKIVAVWESWSHKSWYFTYEQGYADAIAAWRQAQAIGQPAGSAIYFAVDYNAQAPDIYGPIDHYFRGVANGLAKVGAFGKYRIGVYGSGAVCAYLKSRRMAQYAWLSNSTAWTGTAGFTAWNIRQMRASAALSFAHDWNEAQGDYGGFQANRVYSAL